MTIGITGGIGSGKSFVARLLQSNFGIPVYDCDREARRLMNTSAELREALIALIGSEAYSPDGLLNRPAVARYLFESQEHAAAVNAVVHPAVRKDFLLWSSQQPSPLKALESAILLESGFGDLADHILLVTAPEELRLQRAMKRDSASAEQVRSRMAQQTSEEARLAAADSVIINDGRPLLPQLTAVLKTLNTKL